MAHYSTPQLNIAIIKPQGVIAPYVMDGFIRAFREANHRVLVMDRLENIDDLLNFFPDFVLAYGLNGFFRSAEGFLLRLSKIPLVFMYFDNLYMYMDNHILQEIINFPEYYYNFIWDNSLIEIALNKGIKHVFPILLATDPNNFYPSEISTLTNSLAFVGSINQSNPAFSDSTIDKFIVEVIKIKTKQLELPILSICQQLFNLPQYHEILDIYLNNSYTFWNKIYLNIHSLGSPIIRRFVLSNIKKFPVDIYGTGAEEWTDSNLTFHQPVPYGFDLARVYQNHAINLNISSLQLETSVNNRVFDVFAAGGFLLTDYKDDLKKLFPDHWAKITFKDISELETKSEYYLTRKKERTELSVELRNIVLSQHTYLQRAQQILATVYPHIQSNLPVNKQIRKMLKANKL